jgi:hypothetical protein
VAVFEKEYDVELVGGQSGIASLHDVAGVSFQETQDAALFIDSRREPAPTDRDPRGSDVRQRHRGEL